MLKESLARVQPKKAPAADPESVADDFARLKQYAVAKGAQEKVRSASSLSAALMPSPRQATRSDLKTDILHIARLSGRNRGLHNVLVKVAETANAPSVLADLANDARNEIRRAVADNVFTPCEVKLLLAHDNDPEVRFILAENHATPMDVLQALAEDDNPFVAFRAKSTLDRMRMGRLVKAPFATSTVRHLRQA